MIYIRPETPPDWPAIETVHALAFGQPDEGALVAALRNETSFEPKMSFVALRDSEIIAHALYSRLNMTMDGVAVAAAGLAPLAVLPRYQRGGVGSTLVKESLARLPAFGVQAVVVLGEPKFYQRFGFNVEMARRIASPYSGDHFMALELEPGILSSARSGEVTYPKCFEAV